METTVRVCVSCHKIDQGHGVWATLAGQLSGEATDGLCPDCSRSRFPQFYSDLATPEKEKRGVSAILTSITRFIKN